MIESPIYDRLGSQTITFATNIDDDIKYVIRRTKSLANKHKWLRPAIVFFLLALLSATQVASATYNVNITTTSHSVRKLLEAHLDIVRFAKRKNISDEQFNFLATTAPQQIRNLIATNGYFLPSTVHTSVRIVDGKKYVNILVDPGKQTSISSISLSFRGPLISENPAQENTARCAFSLHEGDPFSQLGWKNAKKAVLKSLQTQRYLGAKIAQSEARINPLTHDAKLLLQFDSGPTFTMGAIDISGTYRYPQEIIHNVNPVSIGEIYDERRVTELQRQLQNTSYYASVAVDVDNDITKSINTPIHVKVSEYPYNNFRCSIGYSTDTGPHMQGSYSYLNTFNRSWPFTVSGRVDQIQRYGQIQLALLPEPRAWVNKGLASYTSTNISDMHIYSARLGIQRTRTTQCIDYGYSLFYYQDHLSKLMGAPTMSRAFVPAWIWTRRNVDEPLFPRSGNLIHAEASFALKGILTNQTFIRYYIRGQQYLPIGRFNLLLLRAELGNVFTTTSNSKGVPASLLFRAGGSNSVRGYNYQSIGNIVDGEILPTKHLMTASLEYQHWFNHAWGVSVFFDFGTTTNTWSEKIFYLGLGIGARRRSPFGPVNLDLAYGIREHSMRPYLTLGIAF